MTALARRADTLSLGAYRLDEFNEFYTALIALCAAHDFLCFRWGQMCGAYPIESAVMVRHAFEWRDVLSALSGVAPEKCLEKEAEMRAVLRAAGQRYGADGPLALPNPVPDIDWIAVDESSSTVVIAELKWIRKPLRPAEAPDRDADVLKGVSQLTTIQQFLAQTPAHVSAHGRLPRALNEYEHVYYLLVARDHWRWVEPRDGIVIVEFDAFTRALTRANDLHAAVGDLLGYEWLPVEGRDFFVQYDTATANGVSIESQVFYSTAPG